MTVSTSEKLSKSFEAALPWLFIVMAVSIIGLSIPSLIRIRSTSDMTELQILLLLYAVLVLLTGILHRYDDATIPMIFISVILGSIIIDRRSDWSLLLNKNKVLTGFLGSVMLLSFVLICIFAASMLDQGRRLWELSKRSVAHPAVVRPDSNATMLNKALSHSL